MQLPNPTRSEISSLVGNNAPCTRSVRLPAALRLRVERELNPRWQVFGEHRWEHSRSNEAGFSYRANTVLAGVQRTF